MQRTMNVFVVPRHPVSGAGVPLEPRQTTVEALTLDGLRAAAHAALATPGHRVRSLSFGPDGLVAYVEEVR